MVYTDFLNFLLFLVFFFGYFLNVFFISGFFLVISLMFFFRFFLGTILLLIGFLVYLLVFQVIYGSGNDGAADPPTLHDPCIFDLNYVEKQNRGIRKASAFRTTLTAIG